MSSDIRQSTSLSRLVSIVRDGSPGSLNCVASDSSESSGHRMHACDRLDREAAIVPREMGLAFCHAVSPLKYRAQYASSRTRTREFVQIRISRAVHTYTAALHVQSFTKSN